MEERRRFLFSTPAIENEDIRFSFWRSTFSTITTATAIAHQITEIWFVYKIELIMTGIVLAIIIYRLFKSFKQIQNCPQKGFQFALEIIDRNQKSLILPLHVFPGQIINYHICSDKLIERMEVTGVIRPYLNIRWDVKFFNLNQVNCCSTLRSRYPLSYILAHRLRKVLAQTLLPGCFSVINYASQFDLLCQTDMSNST